MAQDINKLAKWMLPEGIEEALPAQSGLIEQLRRRLLDYYHSCGYDLVMTPFIEYLDVLLAGSGKELDSQTFKLIDPQSGRQMGVRADMTLQAARIDAHQIRKDDPVRLCYLGTVLRTVNDGFAGSRAPLQIGAELYGHAGVESDLEILELMLETLSLTGMQEVHIDLGHVGIFRSLARQAGLQDADEQLLFDALQRKAIPEIGTLLETLGLDDSMVKWFTALADLNGGTETLQRAQKILSGAGAEVIAALDEMINISGLIEQRLPGLPVHYDLAELRGYSYQTGLVFAAFVPGYGQEIARGGRYDDIGSIFGRARPAIGFSADMKTLIHLSSITADDKVPAIFAPADQDQELREKVTELRKAGERVVIALPGQAGGAAEMNCDRKLSKQADGWQVTPV